MSRHGYTDDCENLELYRGTVTRAIRGKRGQKFLIDLRDALDAMPEKVLVSDVLVDDEGDVCALGAVGKKRQVPDLDKIDPEEHGKLAETFDVARCLVQEIEFENDEAAPSDPAKRWEYMRKWCDRHIAKVQP